jgi:phosphohistidine phosphatase
VKELYVIRHGIADDAAGHGGSDEQRQLTKKGKDKVNKVARFLKNGGTELGHVLSSPLARALETAEIVREECSRSGDVVITDLLKPGGSYDDLVGLINETGGDESIAIVGHEPFLSGFVSYCLSGSRHPYVRMKKAGVALLTYEGHLEPGGCELAWLMGPGQMGAE